MTTPVSLLASAAQPALRLAAGDTVGAAMGGFDALLALFSQRGVEEAEPASGAGRRPPAETGEETATADGGLLAGWFAQSLVGGEAPVADAAPAVDGETPDEAAITCETHDAKAGLPQGPRLDQHEAATAALLAQVAGQAPRTTRPPLSGLEQAQANAANAQAAEAEQAIVIQAELADTAAQTTAETTQATTAATQAAAGESDGANAPTAAVQSAVLADARLAETRAGGRRETASAAAELKTARQADGSATGNEAIAPASTVEAAAAAAAADTAFDSAATPDQAIAAPVSQDVATAEAGGDFAAGPTEPAGRTEAGQGPEAAGSTAPRGAPETVAKLVAGILEKLGGQTSRFDLRLDPHGLGTVDVSLEIAADGQLTASMTFDTPQAAQELRARAGELRQALEQAGFTLGEDGLTFDLADQNGRQDPGASQDNDRRPFASQAFARLFDTLEAEAAPIRLSARRGLDIVI